MGPNWKCFLRFGHLYRTSQDVKTYTWIYQRQLFFSFLIKTSLNTLNPGWVILISFSFKDLKYIGKTRWRVNSFTILQEFFLAFQPIAKPADFTDLYFLNSFIGAIKNILDCFLFGRNLCFRFLRKFVVKKSISHNSVVFTITIVQTLFRAQGTKGHGAISPPLKILEVNPILTGGVD